MNILMIDNYDSFTYNLVHYIESNPYGVGIEVVRPDGLATYKLRENIIGLVISPGPSHPTDRPEVLNFIKEHWESLPVLGICLGHQMLWQLAGGQVTHAERPIHGHVYGVEHDGKGLYQDIPSPVMACRYHSLTCFGQTSRFDIVGQTDQGVNMAIRAKEYPVFGLQYHPEAILSEHGREQINNFIRIAVEESHNESTHEI